MTLSTRASIRQEALRRVGGFVETLSSAGDATSVISNAMRYRFGGDDDAGVGMGIYDPADATADQYRVATAWDDSAGDATVDALAAAKAGTETVEFYLRNDPSPQEFNEAINRTLSETERIVETAIPTVEGWREYGLLNAPWIEKRRDIQSVLYRQSPNLLDNGGFELWGVGANAGLHAWTLSGTSATVTRIDGSYGRYGARITATGGNGAVLTQTIPIPIQQLYGKSISVFGRVKSGTAALASIDINDGDTTTQTSQHDGGGDWDELEFSTVPTVGSDASGQLTVKLTLDATNGNADYETLVAVEGTSVPDWLKKYGDQHARADRIHATLQMRGSLPVIVTDRTYSRGAQLVIQSKQQYFELTADSGTGGVTDMPFEAAVAGTIVKLAEIHSVGKPNAARWEKLGSYWLRHYNAWKRQLAEPSPEATPRRVVIAGA